MITKADKRRFKMYNKKNMFGTWKYRLIDILKMEELLTGKTLSQPGLYYSLYKFPNYKPRKPKT